MSVAPVCPRIVILTGIPSRSRFPHLWAAGTAERCHVPGRTEHPVGDTTSHVDHHEVIRRLDALERQVAEIAAELKQLTRSYQTLSQLRQDVASLKNEVEDRSEL